MRLIRFFIFLGVAVLSGILTSCGDDKLDIPDEPLTGMIGGTDWELKFGGGTLFSSDFKYRFMLLSTEESGDDPCSIVSTGNPHLRMILPLTTGSYSLPLPVFSENVKFVLGDGTVLSATAGFIEIIAIDNRKLVGVLKADFDEDNEVLGTFIVDLC